MKQLIKQISNSFGLDVFLAKRSDAAIVLGFHRVEEADESMLSQRIPAIHPSVFEDILNHLRNMGYTFVSLNEFVDRPDRSKKAAITFDDGFRSVYVHAFPILLKFNAPFTVFLTTATLGTSHLLWLHRIYAAVDRLTVNDVRKAMECCSLHTEFHKSLSDVLGNLVAQEMPEKLFALSDVLASEAGLSSFEEVRISERLYLKPEEIEEMLSHGMTIGAHGHTHLPLTSLDLSQTEDEISVCREDIRKTFRMQVEHYALPYGKTNSHVKPVLERLGFKSLCTAAPGLVQAGTDPYDLPRLMDEASVIDLAAQLTQLHMRLMVGMPDRGR